MDLAQVVQELYGLPPAEFVATRTARAKQADDRAVAATIRQLPKPSVAAYVVNQLVRQRHDEIEQLIELGDALRQAQVGLDGAELRKLDQQRRQLTRAVAAEGRRLATEGGTVVSAAAATQVDETLHAAMADPEAADAVRTGRLSRALAASGFGPVDLASAVAAPDALASVTSLTDRRAAAAKRQVERELIAARADLVAAEREATEARAVTKAARQTADTERARRSELEDRLATLRDEVKRVESELAEAKQEAKAAKRRLKETQAAEQQATIAHQVARDRVDELTSRR